MYFDDLQRFSDLNQIKDKDATRVEETTIDKAFPFLF